MQREAENVGVGKAAESPGLLPCALLTELVVDRAGDRGVGGGVCRRWATELSSKPTGSTGTRTGSDDDENPVKRLVVSTDVTEYTAEDAKCTCATWWLGRENRTVALLAKGTLKALWSRYPRIKKSVVELLGRGGRMRTSEVRKGERGINRFVIGSLLRKRRRPVGPG